MQNKTTHRWFDVQVIIAFLAMTASLVLWNLFAKNAPVSNGSSLQVSAPVTSSAPQPQTRILFGNPAPQQPQAPSIGNSQPAPSFAPAPVTVTSSSRP